jgi:uncharacterized membrane protein YcaP (DUF421 family)
MREFFASSGEIILKSLISVIVLFLLCKLMGPRLISQMDYYDYIVGITIGSIAAEMAVGHDLPVHIPIIAMSVYALFTIAIAILTDKSIIIRRFFSGTPYFLIYKGNIVEANLKKSHYDLNNLLSVCRSSGYFDISKIEYAVMEETGKISFLLKAGNQPATANDLKVPINQEELMANVIIDGKVMQKHLDSINKTYEWLMQKLKDQNFNSPKDVFLAVADINGNISVYGKNQNPLKNDYFM